MRPILLAFSFIRIPKLFTTLLLWPLVAGVFAALTQVTLTSFYIRFVDEDTSTYAKRVSQEDSSAHWIRTTLFGESPPLAAVKVCRWHFVNGVEVPPDPSCAIQPLEVALVVAEPAAYNVDEYAEFFSGSTRTLHICQSCSADVTVTLTGDEASSVVKSLRALGIYVLTEANQESVITDNFVTAKATIEHLRDLAGTIYLHPPGFRHPVNVSKASFVMILVMNVAFLIILTLWLSLVGHRKVLQYFSRNEALLPLVAACGKSEFYSAIWVITVLRVGFFLLASVPLTCMIFQQSISDEIMAAFTGTPTHFVLWILAILTSLGALTIIASLAELKQRHSMVSFLYKYIPVTFVLLGTGVWFYTIAQSDPRFATLQIVISALPLVGLSQVVLSPIFRMEEPALIIHSLAATALICVMLRLNSRWFAAHLGEI